MIHDLTLVKWMLKETSKRDIEVIQMIADGISTGEISETKKYKFANNGKAYWRYEKTFWLQ